MSGASLDYPVPAVIRKTELTGESTSGNPVEYLVARTVSFIEGDQQGCFAGGSRSECEEIGFLEATRKEVKRTRRPPECHF